MYCITLSEGPILCHSYCVDKQKSEIKLRQEAMRDLTAIPNDTQQGEFSIAESFALVDCTSNPILDLLQYFLFPYSWIILRVLL